MYGDYYFTPFGKLLFKLFPEFTIWMYEKGWF